MNLPILYISYKWNHTICGLCVWLILLNIMFSRFIHVAVCICTSFLFKTEKYSIILCTKICLSVHRLMDIWVVFTFWLLWMLLWIFMCKFLFKHLFSGFLIFGWGVDIYPGAELLGHMVILCLIYWGTTKLFSTIYHLTIPPAMYEGSNFPTSSPILIFCF